VFFFFGMFQTISFHACLGTLLHTYVSHVIYIAVILNTKYNIFLCNLEFGAPFMSLDFSDSIFELLYKIGVCEIHGDLILQNFMMKDKGL
jgi:hypothetical protein